MRLYAFHLCIKFHISTLDICNVSMPEALICCRLLHEEEKDTVHGNDTSQDANVFSSTAAHDQSKPASSVSSDISKAVVESSSNHEAYDSHDDKRERDLNEDSVGKL